MTRYLPPSCTDAEDLELQVWVRERCRGPERNLFGVVGDRHESFDLLLRECKERFVAPHFVETGCVRRDNDWGRTGASTILFGRYCRLVGGRFDSVDISERNCQLAEELTRNHGGEVTMHVSTGRAWLAKEVHIDVLYLDSLDLHRPKHAAENLAEFRAAIHALHERSLVLIDDTPCMDGRYVGKGALTIPYMVERGWKVIHAGYQVLLTR